MSFWRKPARTNPSTDGEGQNGVSAAGPDNVAWRRSAASGAPERDTNADWALIGAQEPYWGVLTDPKYRRENIDAAAVEDFYATGVDAMKGIVAELSRAGWDHMHARSALDVGCGVGRLAEAMTRYADAVTGLDVSQPMLEIARARGAPVRYVDTLPDESFDWINSFIVMQHIPPERGLGLLEDLLRRLEPNGMISLQLTVWREPRLRVPEDFSPPPGEIIMYDYDFSAVLELLSRNGIERFTVLTTDHGGHHGAYIFGRRSAVPAPQP